MDGAWQFPQGGVDEGETHEQAIVRELREEIGVAPRDFELLEKRGPYRYLYAKGRNKRGFHGAEQHYFLAQFIGEPARITMKTKKPEFQDHRWIQPPAFRLQWLPEMKREVYRRVFADFFKVAL